MSKNKTYKESEGYRAKDLLQSAYHHSIAAQKLLEGTPELFDSGGYLLHLAVELVFKSMLLYLTKEFEGTHSLQSLRDQICKLDTNIKFTRRQNATIQHLDNLYELRYPTRQKPTEIGPEEMELSKNLLEKLINILPEELCLEFQNIPDNKKGGRILMERKKSKPLNFELLTGKKQR
jgi:HEPN domain-containing protein